MTEISDAPPLPPIPRPLTPRVRRRSWAEAAVRVWMIMMLIVAAVTIYFIVTRVREARNDRWLIEHGVDVQARFTMVSGDPVPKRRPRNEMMNCTIVYTYNNQDYQLPIALDAKPDAYAMVGTILPIKIDPNDPTRWTEETQPKPWSQELTAAGLLLPLVVLLFAIMLWKRLAVLNIWKRGELVAGTVVDTRQTTIAPRSRVVRFALQESEDRRVHSTWMPQSAGIPQPGETIWLLCPPGRPGRAVVAKLYQ